MENSSEKKANTPEQIELLKLIVENVVIKNQTKKELEDLHEKMASLENLKNVKEAKLVRIKAFKAHGLFSFLTFKESMMIDSAACFVNFQCN